MRKSNQELLNQKCWIKASEEDILWLDLVIKESVRIPNCNIYFHKNGNNVLLYDYKYDLSFTGSIQERFVGPDAKSNLEEIKEWFDTTNTPYTIGVGVKEYIPEYNQIAEDWFSIKIDGSEENDRWFMYIIAKKLGEKENE